MSINKLCVALMVVSMGAARAQTFSAPVQLSQHGYGNSPMLAMDGTGTALAVWADEGASYSIHAPGMAWTAPQAVYIQGGSGLTMQMNAAGFATIASYQNGYGIYIIDRPPGGAWTAPTTVVTGENMILPSRTSAPPMIFVGNATGDQAIVWEQYNAGLQIMAVHRPAGGAWGTPEQVAVPPVGLNLALAAAAIGANGDVLVAWETFQTTCSRSCAETNFIVHAAREQSGTGIWNDSGPLTPPITPDGYVVAAMIDSAGHGGMVLQPGQFPSQLLATRQGAGGGKWSPVITAFADTAGGYPNVWGAATGAHAQGSFVSVDFGSPLRILWGDGNLVTDTWGAPADLSATDVSNPGETLAFGANAADGAVVTWVDADDAVRAALRRKGGKSFAPTQTVVPGDGCLLSVVITACKAPGVAAINAAGQAVMIFSLTNSTATMHTLFATTTN